MIQRGGNRNFRYTTNARNTPDVAVPPQGIMGAMLPVPIEIGGVPVANADAGVPQQPLPISALASALASAPPEQQRAVIFSTFLFLYLVCQGSSCFFFTFSFVGTFTFTINIKQMHSLSCFLRCLVSSFTLWWTSWSMILLAR